MTARQRHGRRFRTFIVAGDSMLPNLGPGDRVLAIRSTSARVGQLRVLLDPMGSRQWLVKRVSEVSDDGSEMRLSSDNRAVTRADSRTFGAVDVAGSYRVLARLRARA